MATEKPIIDSGAGKMNRREFLDLMEKAALGLIGTAVVGAISETLPRYDPTFKISFDKDNKTLGLSECFQLAERMDKLYDQIPEYHPTTTKEDLIRWTFEFVPMFEYEGIVSRSRWPAKDVGFLAFLDGHSHNHVAGRSDCANYAGLNLRFANNHSSWYEDDNVPMTLLHELAHIQQGEQCRAASRDLVENSAQIGALEVAAALVNQGNTELLPSLVAELRGMALSATYAAAIREGNIDIYTNLRNRLSPGALSEARFAKSRRRWSEHPADLMSVLDRYNVVPLLMISNAIRFNNSEITQLAFPPVIFENRGAYFVVNPEPKPIKLDDLAYFLAHAEDMVREAAQKM